MCDDCQKTEEGRKLFQRLEEAVKDDDKERAREAGAEVIKYHDQQQPGETNWPIQVQGKYVHFTERGDF